MKRIFTLLVILSSAVAAGYAQKAPKADESLKLKEILFDFGKIPQGRPVTHNFEVVNNGKTPLMIESVEASCGCTTPEWSQEPVPPGASTTIKVGFNASSEGKFAKTITIIYNGSQVKTMQIKGEVFPSPTTSAPLNTSLSIIK